MKKIVGIKNTVLYAMMHDNNYLLQMLKNFLILRQTLLGNLKLIFLFPNLSLPCKYIPYAECKYSRCTQFNDKYSFC